MKKDSIVFITGSKSSLPFIKEAKKRGFKAIVIDNDPECVSKAIADNFALFSAANEESILNYLKGVSDEFEIKGVITYSSLPFALSTASRISHEYGLPSFNKESVEITYNKDALQHALMSSKCNVPKTFRNLGELSFKDSQVNFPAVLKLKSGIGSLGTKIINSIEELKQNIAQGQPNDFILQEYIDGPLMHIDGFITDGEPHFLTLFQKLTHMVNSIPLTKGFMHAPDEFKHHEKLQALISSISDFIHKTKMDNNFFGADFIYSEAENDFYLLEIGYLMDVKVDRLLFHSGINPYSLLIDISMGKEISINLEDINHNLALEFIYPIKTGYFVKIKSKDMENYF